MCYRPAFDVIDAPIETLRKTPPGQWVHDGDKATKGRFMGVTKAGAVVVAWGRKATDMTVLAKLRTFAKT